MTGVAVIVALVFFAGYLLVPETTTAPMTVPAPPHVETGDWIFRRGTSADSQLILHLGKGRFSHIGIISAVDPEIRIIHAMTDDGGETGEVREISFTEFVTQEAPEQAMILRPVFLSAAEKRRVVERVRRQLGKPFVLSARDDSPLYCTTLLYDAIAEVNPGFSPEWKQIDLPVFRGQYLFPNAFAQYQNTRVVWDSDNLQE
jgi:hypothetical protein